MSEAFTDSPTVQLLRAAAEGNSQAARDLLPHLYDELRKLAESWMAHQTPGHTLQPTALVHEAYARLVGSGATGWEGRRHFFFAAARAMQDILVEHARRNAALKRGGDRRRVDMSQVQLAIDAPVDDEEMLVLDEALNRLAARNKRMHTVVMLRYFAGLTIRQCALALGVDSSTVARDWRLSRAWLYGQIAGSDHSEDEGDA